MTIHTKLDVGQVGFFMHENKVCSGAVEKIIIVVEDRLSYTLDIKYTISVNIKDRPIVVEENNLFINKPDLLNSL